MTEIKNIKCINALELKVLAMALMLCDHLWATIVPGAQWLTDLGRLAFPIFAFQIAEGYTKTKNYKQYWRRVLMFALISEVPYDMMMAGLAPIRGVLRELGCLVTGGGFSSSYLFRCLFGLMTHQNVMFTFLLALTLIRVLDKTREKNKILFWVMLPVAAGVGWLLGQLLFVDYHGEGVLTVLLFWLCRGLHFGWVLELAGMVLLNCVMLGGMTIPVSLFGLILQLPQQGLALLALIPIWLYNGQQGPHSKAIRYACYAFYPVHILSLSLIALYVL